MTLNALRHKRTCTRGQCPAAPPEFANFCDIANSGGAETGSTRVVKAKFVSGMVSAVIGPRLLNANDNHTFVAANDNGVVAGNAIAA